MKKKRLFPGMLLALCLCAVFAVSALAEGAVSALYRAGTALLFETDNATLNVHADFAYNGLPFKTMDALYLQDGANSQLELKLKTPMQDGTVFDSGFTVVGYDGTAYAIDPVDNPYVYNTSAYASSGAILSSSTLRRALVRLGGLVAESAEGALSDQITVSAENGGTQYHVQLQEGQTPALVNAAGTVLTQLAAERYFNVDYRYYGNTWPLEADENRDMLIIYDNYWATFSVFYGRLFEEELPDSFFETLWGDETEERTLAQERYQQVEDAIYVELEETLRQEHTGGAAVVRPDGSVDYYETVDLYYAENDQQMIDFADFDAAYCAYYQKITGSELTREELNAIYYSDNGELIDAYNQIYEQMMDEYWQLVRADGKASMIYVNADGSYRMIYDYNAYLRSTSYYDNTLTRRILYTMEALEVGDADFTVSLDEEGRITAAQGSVTVIVVDGQGYRNQLEITFDATVAQYGETHVAEFDPLAYGVMSWEEFQQTDPADLPAQAQATEPPLPETIMFAGVQYQLILDDAVGEDL